jgi:hypothetical protein
MRGIGSKIRNIVEGKECRLGGGGGGAKLRQKKNTPKQTIDQKVGGKSQANIWEKEGRDFMT